MARIHTEACMKRGPLVCVKSLTHTKTYHKPEWRCCACWLHDPTRKILNSGAANINIAQRKANFGIWIGPILFTYLSIMPRMLSKSSIILKTDVDVSCSSGR